jgi:hypothetical protein
LQTGDLLYLNLREREIQFLDEIAFRVGILAYRFDHVKVERQGIAELRLQTILQRGRQIAASNRLAGHTDAAHGVVPLAVYEEAIHDYKTDVKYLTVQK